jgi:hypothetical protein
MDFNLQADIFSGFGRFLGQFLHLIGRHLESLPGFSCALLDRRIQCQQVGLLGDRRNRLDGLANFGTRLSRNWNRWHTLARTCLVRSSIVQRFDATTSRRSNERAITAPPIGH